LELETFYPLRPGTYEYLLVIAEWPWSSCDQHLHIVRWSTYRKCACSIFCPPYDDQLFELLQWFY